MFEQNDSDSDDSQQGQAEATSRDPPVLLEESLDFQLSLECRAATGPRILSQRIQGTELEESEDQTARRQLSSSSTGQQTSNVRIEGEDTTMPSTTGGTGGMPTIHVNATDMFKDADPIDKSKLAGGTCELPRSRRGSDEKTIGKNKERCCRGLKVKFGLNYFQVSGKYGEDDDNETSAAARNSHDAIISCSYRCEEMKLRIKAFDLKNACLVPKLKNETGATPSDRWDFNNRRHLLDHYGLITLQVIKQWGDDCARW